MSNNTQAAASGPPPQDVRKRDLLPDPEELVRQRNLPPERRPTLQEIADRYGVSRQAVHKRIQKYVTARSAPGPVVTPDLPQ